MNVRTTSRMLRGAPIFEDIEIVELAESAEESPHRLMAIRGTASRGGVVNENNRMYPTEVLTKAVEEARSKLGRGKFLGELDHPTTGGGQLANAAIKFTDVWMEGDLVRYEGDVLPTERGRTLETLLRSGVGVGMSTRGYGSLEERDLNGKRVMFVQPDYEIVGIDAVLEESNPYGKVLSFENEGRGAPMDLTLEQLKEQYADVAAEFADEIRESLRAEVQEELNADFEEKVRQAVEERKEEFIEQGRQEALESEEVKAQKELLDKISEAVKPLFPEEDPAEIEESVKRENEEMEGKLAEMESRLEEIEADRKALAEQIEARETQEKIDAKISEVTEGHAHAELLRERLSECKSEEEVTERFEAEVAFIKNLLEDRAVPTGGGKVTEEEEGTLDESRKRQRELAGIRAKEGK